MDNKKVGIGAASAGVVAAVATTLAVTNPGTTEIQGSYDIDIVNPYKAEMRISVPEELFTPDIVTLNLNDLEVSKTLLPQGYFTTYPLVLSDPSRLNIDMEVRGEEAATATFNEDGTLTITVKDKYLKTEKEPSATTTAEPIKNVSEESDNTDVESSREGETNDAE